jgi:ribosomal protein L7/L12
LGTHEVPSAPDDSQYQRYLALARELEASGSSMDDVLGALRAAGAYAIPSIKVLRELYGFSLAEAKDRLHASPVWADEAPDWERLHEQLARAFLEHGAEVDGIDRDQAG